MKQFRAMLVLIETVGAAQIELRLSQRAGGTTGVQCVPFSKSKRESRLVLTLTNPIVNDRTSFTW